MPKRIVLVSTAVVRDGVRKYPELNKPFDFTQDEIDTIMALHPTGLRKPINETAADTDTGTAGSGEKPNEAKPTATKAPKKQKKATQRAQESSEKAAAERDGEDTESDEDADTDADEDEDI